MTTQSTILLLVIIAGILMVAAMARMHYRIFLLEQRLLDVVTLITKIVDKARKPNE
jgi:hypothetical protein